MYMGYFKSTIGRKQVVGIMGIGLSLFVLIHMLGNLLILVGAEAYNKYGHMLTSNPAIEIVELGLAAIFLLHVVFALKLSWDNHKARPKKYAVQPSGEKKTSFTQKTMWHQGVIILVFVALHLISFKYGEVYMVSYGGEEVRDFFRLIQETFQSPIYVLWYLVALVILMFHLGHGLSSSLKTLGLSRLSHMIIADKVGQVYAIVVALGFILPPLYIFFYYE